MPFFVPSGYCMLFQKQRAVYVIILCSRNRLIQQPRKNSKYDCVLMERNTAMLNTAPVPLFLIHNTGVVYKPLIGDTARRSRYTARRGKGLPRGGVRMVLSYH